MKWQKPIRFDEVEVGMTVGFSAPRIEPSIQPGGKPVERTVYIVEPVAEVERDERGAITLTTATKIKKTGEPERKLGLYE